jgi:hypothetical protein
MGKRAMESSSRSHRHDQTLSGRLTPARALERVRRDPELIEAHETLKREYPEHLVNLCSGNAKLSQLKAKVLKERPYCNRRAYLTGPKFERAIQGILDTQNGITELQTFTYKTLSRDTRVVPRIDLLWLKEYFQFPNDVIARHLNCSVRQVAKMTRELKAYGLRFRHPRSNSQRPASFGPLPKKPQFDRSLTPDEHAWIADVRSGKANIKLDGQGVTGPEAAKELKYLLHRDRDKEQYDAWVDKHRLIGYSEGGKPYDPDWLPHSDGKAIPQTRKVTSLPIEDEEESKAHAFVSGIDKSKPSSTYQPILRRKP